jgi:hypothetical protein
MSARYTSHVREAKARIDRATDAALVASAQVIVNKVKEGLRGGYTTGDYVTGTNTASVIRSDPLTRPSGRTILIGSSIKDPHPDYPYPLLWELGHFNIFVSEASGGAEASSVSLKRTGRYVRKEVWRPALFNNKDRAQAAFSRVFARFMAGGGGSVPRAASEAAD